MAETRQRIGRQPSDLFYIVMKGEPEYQGSSWIRWKVIDIFEFQYVALQKMILWQRFYRSNPVVQIRVEDSRGNRIVLSDDKEIKKFYKEEVKKETKSKGA